MDSNNKQFYDLFTDIMYLRDRLVILNNQFLASPYEICKDTLYTKYKLSIPQINIIYLLYKNGPMSVGEIAKAEGIIKQAITQPIRALLNAGLLIRFQKPDNYRYVYVDLTDLGREVYTSHVYVRNQFLLEKFQGLFSLEDLEKMKQSLFCYVEMLQRLGQT